MAKKKSSTPKAIHTSMRGISSLKPSRSAVEKKYPHKSSSHGDTDTYQPRPPKR